MDIIQQEFDGKTILVYPCGDVTAPAIVFLSFEPCGGRLINELAPGCKRFNLIEITGLRWEDELTPWKHPPLRRGDPGFGGNGYAFLMILSRLIVPHALSEIGLKPKHIAIAGYSLAGMFSLYAASRCDAFDAALSVSGSLWFDGLAEFIKEHGTSKNLRYVYLSLGQKEPMSKNPQLATVGEKTEELCDYYLSQGIKTDFEWNEGGHFDNETRRIALAISSYLGAFED